MNKIVSDLLWDEIDALAEKSKTKLAAIAYVFDDSKIRFGRNDVLVVDASDTAIKAAQTSVRLLQDALARGAELYSCPGLHAKVIVLDQTAVVGSANMSRSSRNELVEAALISEDPDIVSEAIQFIAALTDAAEVTKIDRNFIRRIAKLPVTRNKPPLPPARSRPRIKLTPARTWIISVHPLNEERYKHEEKLAEKGLRKAEALVSDPEAEIEWIRFTGSSKFRREAKIGDQVIQLWGPPGMKTVEAVYRHAPIIYRQLESNCTRFYIACDPDAKKHMMSWSGFQRLVTQVGLPGRISKSSIREVDPSSSKRLTVMWTPSKKPTTKAKPTR